MRFTGPHQSWPLSGIGGWIAAMACIADTAESISESISTSGTYATKLSYSQTRDAGTYLLIVSGEIANSSVITGCECRIQIGGVTRSEGSNPNTAYTQAPCFAILHTHGGGALSITMQWRRVGVVGNALIRRARIQVLGPVTPFVP